MAKIFSSRRCLEYDSYPESRGRVDGPYELLKEIYEIVEPKPCEESDLLLAHDERFIKGFRDYDRSVFDLESPPIPGIYDYALLSAGAALNALASAEEMSFSLMRPPGHHSGRNFMGGFCYLNNIAIAVKKSMPKHDRVAIVDFDCHHGNGTQDIFLGDPRVLYVSLHQRGIFPGTGYRSEENCLNYPLMSGTGEGEYLRTLEKALGEVKRFNPSLIGVSAGFDPYKGDPITSLFLEVSSFKKIGEAIRDLNLPTFAVLEGGYSSELPLCVEGFLEGLF
jgi:acetoin utilization deacetylase AcuC-like enzyme